MPTAQDLLSALQAAGLPITGFTMRDAANVATWTFYGKGVTDKDAARAVFIIEDLLAAPPVPDPITLMQEDLVQLRTKVDELTATVEAALPKRP